MHSWRHRAMRTQIDAERGENIEGASKNERGPSKGSRPVLSETAHELLGSDSASPYQKLGPLTPQ
jgi:hypothetical protein